MTQKDIIELILKSKKMSARTLGLRFDRVALGLLEEIHSQSKRHIPKGTTLLISITAPIRQPSQTSLTIEKKIESFFSKKTHQDSYSFDAHSNHVQIRLVEKLKNKSPLIVGFVHNSNINPNQLFEIIEEWLTKSR